MYVTCRKSGNGYKFIIIMVDTNNSACLLPNNEDRFTHAT